MSTRLDVLLWAQRVVARKPTTPAHVILEIAVGASPEAVQAAFHAIARMAHPDLHRNGLNPEELELVTTAYARTAAAYQELRGRPTTAPLPRGSSGTAPPPRTPGTSVPPPRQRGDSIGVTTSGGPTADTPLNPAQAMSAKALVYYRKAELCLRRGDLTGAVLQLKMAIASDPQSQFLRSALAEVQSEVGKPR